ncbi:MULTISPECIES: type IV secretory system conjugative DNA transfer family protein [Haematobacter]|mgnify:CR=1 FL=1|uniref:Type VI secretion protein n=3 Tax=Haematobacter TaxID=366614 RepID=A0A086XTN8_9RHOB|nr:MULTISPECIES: type IV secretory system conjugative DNA transfer family protein [Haematobacter]KFI25388.1 type VI secretion protein [Haematobacter massiliensis]OWJ69499.1 type VI secretion protein [Haematobacter massiliensis]OWJ74890.1 type VI secretion protein [Haematobacter genomosp. 1]OWJ81001.1 type VI secretion protein [Haematobacter missouriensis]OWJ81392.1 type VI secretion protein [Haematobacter massiliensis]
MDKGRMLLGAVVLTLLGFAIGYVLATIYFSVQYAYSTRSFDLTLLARNWLGLRTSAPQDFLWVNGIILGTGLAALLLTATMLGDALTSFGTTHWQSRAEMKRNGFFAGPGAGFLLGKMGSPKSKKPFIVSRTFPHALVVAPTGRGKGVGFVIPNLLTYRGSAVVLDVKGENFRETSRFRASTGDKVFRFAPTDWERPTHRYNPLARIAALKNPDRQQMELKLTAKLFLQTDNEKLSGLLAGGIDLFVAAGLLAFERGNPTIGEIYRITASGGNKQLEFMKRAEEVKNPSAKLIFERMASTNNDTLTSYLSLLMTSGLDTWDNRAIDAATATSDFSFRDIRRQPHAIYLVVESEMVRPLAPLIRLFFSDLIASLQAAEPGKDEPWPVMIMLDEFDRLGKMPIVAESIKTLRSYGGNLAIVTQTIPALDEIYGENTRRSLQGGAGVKLYLTPSDQKTIEELSQAVGKTTKRVVTRSRSVGRNPFEGRSVTERTEETPLLNEDEARRLNLDEVILVIDAQMPIRAWRIKYYEDPALKVIHAGQSGSHPYPDAEKRQYEARLKETEETVERLSRALSAVAGAPGKKARKRASAPVPAAPRLRAPLRRETASTPPEPIRIDLTALGTVREGRQAVEAAVLKTAGILAQHAPGA